MRATVSARAGLFVVTLLGLGAVALGARATRAEADDGDVLKPVKASSGATSLARHGELALERLPGEQLIVRLGLGGGRPVAVTNVFVMTTDLLVVEDNGRVTCLDRHDLQPRWVWTLAGQLFRGAPAEGTGHYVFLTRGGSGQAIVEALSRRTGTPPAGYPVYLPYATSAGLAANTSMVFIASLGGPRDNKTLATLELATGSPAWGWYTTGQLLGDPVLDPSGKTLIVVGDDGVVTALPATSSTPEQPAWTARGLGRITTTPTVTPEHVVVGSHDGLVRALDLRSGTVLWMKSIGEAIRTPPWVLGGMVTEERSTGVEGAPTVKVEVYKGLVFARNVTGLHAFDLQTGEHQFTCPGAKGSRSRPLCRRGKWVLVADGERRVSLHDASDKYKVKGTLDLSMFDLLPMNTTDGTIYGVTADGGLVAAHPR